MKKAALFLMLFGAAVMVSAQSKQRLAMLPFTGNNPQDAERIAEFFSYEPDITRNFTVVPRTSVIEIIMKKQEFQRFGLTDSDTISQLGKQMNADLVLAGHMTSLGTSKLLLMTIVHVKQLRQIAGGYKEYQRIEEMIDFLPGMAKRIADAARQDSSGLPRLAVLPFNVQTSGVDIGDAEVLAQILATDIANSGKYAVFRWTLAIKRVMRDHNIQWSGMTDPKNIRWIGAAVNATYVLSANFRSLGSSKCLSASILDIQQASQMKESRKQYQRVSDGLTQMAELAGELTGGAVPSGLAQPAAVSKNFVLVEGGTFQMGSNNGDNDEKPVRQVTVKSFYMCKYEVTQKEWVEVMGGNPSNFRGDMRPVKFVCWDAAVEYCNKRSQKEGVIPAYRSNGGVIICDFNANGYRLPTEAEWEYAAKGGNKDSITYEYSGSDNEGAVAWFNGNSRNKTHDVGTKAPNSLGIYDMSGNVWEWCWDWYGAYGSEAQTDPVGASSGSGRVRRGGSWVSDVEYLRSAGRGFANPSYRYYDLGFRVLRPQV